MYTGRLTRMQVIKCIQEALAGELVVRVEYGRQVQWA